MIESIPAEAPVFIHAYLSPEVPRSYLEVRRDLISFLREFSAVGRDRIYTRIIETTKYSPEAREARERYGIEAFRVPATEESAGAVNEIYMGLVFTCGPEEFVIPFFDRGLPVEYELMRSIRVVSHAQRRKVGILETKARIFGGFDFETKRQSQDWSIIAELRKQYEVVRVPAGKDYPEDLDVLMAVLPNTLGRQDRLRPGRLRSDWQTGVHPSRSAARLQPGSRPGGRRYASGARPARPGAASQPESAARGAGHRLAQQPHRLGPLQPAPAVAAASGGGPLRL